MRDFYWTKYFHSSNSRKPLTAGLSDCREMEMIAPSVAQAAEPFALSPLPGNIPKSFRECLAPEEPTLGCAVQTAMTYSLGNMNRSPSESSCRTAQMISTYTLATGGKQRNQWNAL